jgi:hypothetical protein
MARLPATFGDDEICRWWGGKIMEPKEASAEDLAVLHEAGRRLPVDRDRREAIQQSVLVAGVLALIVGVVFGGG